MSTEIDEKEPQVDLEQATKRRPKQEIEDVDLSFLDENGRIAEDRQALKDADRARLVLGVIIASVGALGGIVCLGVAMWSLSQVLYWMDAMQIPHPHLPYLLAAKGGVATAGLTFFTGMIAAGQRLMQPLWWMREYDRERIEASAARRRYSRAVGDVIAVLKGRGGDLGDN